MVLWTSSRFYTLELLLAGWATGDLLLGMPKVEPGLTTYKAKASPAVLSLDPWLLLLKSWLYAFLYRSSRPTLTWGLSCRKDQVTEALAWGWGEEWGWRHSSPSSNTPVGNLGHRFVPLGLQRADLRLLC